MKSSKKSAATTKKVATKEDVLIKKAIKFFQNPGEDDVFHHTEGSFAEINKLDVRIDDDICHLIDNFNKLGKAIPKNLRNDKLFMGRLLFKNGNFFKFLSPELQQDLDWLAEIISWGTWVLEGLPKELQNNEELIVKILQKGLFDSNGETIFSVRGDLCEWFNQNEAFKARIIKCFPEIKKEIVEISGNLN